MDFRVLIFLIFWSGYIFSSVEDFVYRRVDDFRHKAQIPGLAVGLFVFGKPSFLNFGYAGYNKTELVTEETAFEIGSLTKLFTATLLALDIMRGNLTLQTSLRDFLPYDYLRTPLALCTLQELATHTSGLPRKSPLGKKAALSKTLSYMAHNWRPHEKLGSLFLYSNLGYNVLGFALERFHNVSYKILMRNVITDPLGMYQTSFKKQKNLTYADGFTKRGVPVEKVNVLGAAGGLKSTTHDLMKFVMANLGVYGSPELIQALQLTHKPFFRRNDKFMQGLAWDLYKKEGTYFLDKNGGFGGFSSWLGIAPESKIGLILLSNKRNPQLTGFGRNLLSELAHRMQKN